MLEWQRDHNRLACREFRGRSRLDGQGLLVHMRIYKLMFSGAASANVLQSSVPYSLREVQVALGKPGLWPALVLNTVLMKPGGQLPLAGVREAEVSEVPEVSALPDPPEAELPEPPEPPEEPDESEVATLGAATLALVLDGEDDS